MSLIRFYVRFISTNTLWQHGSWLYQYFTLQHMYEKYKNIQISFETNQLVTNKGPYAVIESSWLFFLMKKIKSHNVDINIQNTVNITINIQNKRYMYKESSFSSCFTNQSILFLPHLKTKTTITEKQTKTNKHAHARAHTHIK